MDLKKIETQLQKNKFLDEKNIYLYASMKNMIGGICGSVKGLVLLVYIKIHCMFIMLILIIPMMND